MLLLTAQVVGFGTFPVRVPRCSVPGSQSNGGVQATDSEEGTELEAAARRRRAAVLRRCRCEVVDIVWDGRVPVSTVVKLAVVEADRLWQGHRRGRDRAGDDG